MCYGTMKTACGVCVGILAAIGGATVAMLATERGRQILKSVGDCACGCTKTVGNAAEDIVTEMKDCFQSVKEDCKNNTSCDTASN